MKKQKTIFSLFVLLFGAVTAVSAQSLSMNIMQWSGEDTTVEAAAFDKFTFDGDNLVVNYTDGSTASIDLLSIRKITFSGNSSGIDAAGANDKLTVSVAAGRLLLNNLPEGQTGIAVYSLSGTPVRNTVVNSAAPSVDLNRLDKGIYIVKVNNQAIKFVRP